VESSKTNDFGYQNQLLKPESDPAWLETPGALFLAPTRVAQPLVWRGADPCLRGLGVIFLIIYLIISLGINLVTYLVIYQVKWR
jgi:hypothetical protein